MDRIKWVKESVANNLSVCLCLSTCHIENMWRRVLWNLFRTEVVAHWQTALPCSASSLLSFLTPFDIFNYVFHTWLSSFFFSHSTRTSSPSFAFLSLTLLPILFLHLYSISFLSGRSLIALCVGSFHMWGSGSPGILLLLCSVVDGVSRVQRGERGTEQPRSRKDAVRYVKDSCSIYLLILRGTSQARCTKIGSLVFFGWLHPSYHSSTWK